MSPGKKIEKEENYFVSGNIGGRAADEMKEHEVNPKIKVHRMRRLVK